jgi:hypothetical protein
VTTQILHTTKDKNVEEAEEKETDKRNIKIGKKDEKQAKGRNGLSLVQNPSQGCYQRRD